MKWFSVILISFVLVGCSSTKAPERQVAFVPRPAPPPPAPKTVVRTLGSLWSTDSRWNEMYSVPVARTAGDTVHVQLSDALKARIIARIPVDPEKVKEEQREQERRENPNRDVQGVRTFQHELGQAAKPVDSKVFDALIREVLPRGMYNVYSSEVLTINGKQMLVTVDAHIREQDVGVGDTVSSDQLINAKLEVQTETVQK